YRSDTGWARGRRLDFDELRSHRESLPPEDIAVLAAIDAAPRHGRVPSEAIEALCGHPRVFNGNRGRQAVEVVRGHCRIETTEERGHLVIRPEPAGAEEGVHVVVEGETRVVVYRVDAAFAKLNALLSGELRIPSNQKQEGLAVLARLAPHLEICSPALGSFRALRAEAGPCLRISSDAGAFWVEVGVRPFGELGRFFPPGLGNASVTVHGGNEFFEAERDTNEELTQFAKLLALCPTLEAALKREAEVTGNPDEQRFSATLGEEDLFGLLTELREAYPTCPIEWKNGRAVAARGKLTVSSLKGSLRRVKGWYIVDGTVTLGQVTEQSIAELVRLPYTKSGRFLRLPNGDFVEVERRVRQLLTRLANVGELSARHSASEIKLPEAAFDTVHSLLELESGISVDASTTEWLSHVEVTLKSEPAVPEGLTATLRPYQVAGYQWLHRYSRLGLGVCLADDMGLGKTLQVIALLLTRATAGPALVVAPTSVCSNWLDELLRFAPSLACAEYSGRTRAALLEGIGSQLGTLPRAPRLDVIIVSYALLQHDSEQLTGCEWNTVVLDEAQFIKNPHSRRAKAAYRLKARYRLAMTGTPVENHLGDLWSLFHFLNPSLLGSLKYFQLRYTRPIERDQDSEQQVALKRLVQPFLLRRTKDEVLSDLPPLTILRHEIRLSDDEAMRYALLRKNIHEKLSTPQTRRDNKLEILAEITRLRRFCCHPRLVFPDAPTDSSKLGAFLQLVDEMRENGHRALVFSQYVDFLELVREQLDERGLKYLYLDGSTKKETRRTRVRAFQAGEGDLFLISLKAGGFGLNLTGADYVIHLDPWWNPAVEAQASDRAHRIGQQRPVTVYRLVTKDSIEERILNLHHEKRAIADALLDGTNVATQLSEDELLTLLSGDG
ncbi:MAG TPA: DEAD/DEAH box helicase, partial [Polyangiaceae bacterium]